MWYECHPFDKAIVENCKVAPYIAYLALFIQSPFIREVSRSLDTSFFPPFSFLIPYSLLYSPQSHVDSVLVVQT